MSELTHMFSIQYSDDTQKSFNKYFVSLLRITKKILYLFAWGY